MENAIDADASLEWLIVISASGNQPFAFVGNLKRGLDLDAPLRLTG